jgi:uncharacterized membrane protein YbhN (UPF0104 family)
VVSGITLTTSYWSHLAPAMLVSAAGFGLGVMALTQATLYHVDGDKAGIASALLNTAQQIGVALGIAILAGIAATGTAHSTRTDSGAPLTDGYSAALLVSFAMLLIAALLAMLLLRRRRLDPAAGGQTPATDSVTEP